MKALAIVGSLMIGAIAGGLIGPLFSSQTETARATSSEADLAKIAGLQAEVEVQRGTIARLEGEVKDLMAESTRYRDSAEAGALEVVSAAELERCREQTRQYRDGLRDAVATLNQARAAEAAASTSQRQPTVLGSNPRAREIKKPVPFVRQPYASVVGNNVAVSGTINNTDTVPAVGQVEVELYLDGAVVQTQRIALEIQPRTVAEYTTEFTASIGSKQVRVAASWFAL